MTVLKNELLVAQKELLREVTDYLNEVVATVHPNHWSTLGLLSHDDDGTYRIISGASGYKLGNGEMDAEVLNNFAKEIPGMIQEYRESAESLILEMGQSLEGLKAARRSISPPPQLSRELNGAVV